MQQSAYMRAPYWQDADVPKAIAQVPIRAGDPSGRGPNRSSNPEQRSRSLFEPELRPAVVLASGGYRLRYPRYIRLPSWQSLLALLCLRQCTLEASTLLKITKYSKKRRFQQTTAASVLGLSQTTARFAFRKGSIYTKAFNRIIAKEKLNIQRLYRRLL